MFYPSGLKQGDTIRVVAPAAIIAATNGSVVERCYVNGDIR